MAKTKVLRRDFLVGSGTALAAGALTALVPNPQTRPRPRRPSPTNHPPATSSTTAACVSDARAACLPVR